MDGETILALLEKSITKWPVSLTGEGKLEIAFFSGCKTGSAFSLSLMLLTEEVGVGNENVGDNVGLHLPPTLSWESLKTPSNQIPKRSSLGSEQ